MKLFDISNMGINDLASLPDLNEEIILEQLKTRYANDCIYVSMILLNIKSSISNFA